MVFEPRVGTTIIIKTTIDMIAGCVHEELCARLVGYRVRLSGEMGNEHVIYVSRPGEPVPRVGLFFLGNHTVIILPDVIDEVVLPFRSCWATIYYELPEYMERVLEETDTILRLIDHELHES